jgi:FKBP-type peptidyl-prolyl cis-trans isomerase
LCAELASEKMKSVFCGKLLLIATCATALRVPAHTTHARIATRPQLPAAAAAALASTALAIAPTLPAFAEPGDIWDRLANEPPISFNPFTINPAGYAFFGLYAAYFLWQVFGPTSAAEQAWGEKMKAEAAVAAAAEPGFLVQAANEEGARVMPSGLVFKELAAGSGECPTLEQMVTVHYHGTLHTGEVFDSSRDRGQPAEFKLGQVVKGWREGVGMMRPGGKAVLTLPSALAYGAMSMGKIPGSSALRFEVELIAVKDAPKGLFGLGV